MKPPLPRLLLICDFARGEDAVFAAVERAVHGRPGVGVLHRRPEASAAVAFASAKRLREVCARAGAPLFVSARLDLALALGCHLHLPAWALSPGDVRAALGPARLLSCAVHDAAEAARAEGADLALVSPVWPAGSKPGDTRPPLGPAGFAELAARLPCPAFALGGVTPERLASSRPARPVGAAAVGYVLADADPGAAADRLLAALE